jgi:hypothetical protein
MPGNIGNVDAIRLDPAAAAFGPGQGVADLGHHAFHRDRRRRHERARRNAP